MTRSAIASLSTTVTELESWSDFRLEEVGRLTEPMRLAR
jgi:hypothetical protein